jgi:hypothetical protein
MKRSTHAWALLADADAVQRLSELAAEGLEYARLIADADRLRCEAPIRAEQLLPPMTIGEVAEMSGASSSAMRRRIDLARRELFGTLTMSGIYDRQRRARKRQALGDRVCAAADGSNVLPPSATVRREFCHSRCRRREHYRRHLTT